MSDEQPTPAPGVESALSRLDTLDALGVEDHAPVYDAVHRDLRDALADAATDTPTGTPTEDGPDRHRDPIDRA